MNVDNVKRENNLDVIKGIMMIFIIVTHYGWDSEVRLKLLFPFWIDMAVPSLMIISGYVYAKSYMRNNITEMEKAYKLTFILKKINRYTIPFLITIIIQMILSRKTSFMFVPESKSLILKWILSGGTGPGSYYYPCMIQLIFYFPLIYFGIKKYKMGGG